MNCRIIAKGALALLVKRFAGPFWVRRKWLDKTQWFSASELKVIQLELLKKLIHHCYGTIPYYKRLMDDRGIAVESIKSLADIKQFPILQKMDVLKAVDSIVSNKYPKWCLRKAFTGGSTGTPLNIYRNLFSIGNEHAFVRRQFDWAGISLSDRSAWMIAGRRLGNPNETRGNLYAYDPFMKELTLSTYHLSPETADKYVRAMQYYRVKALVGLPSSVFYLAKVCDEKQISLKLKAVLTTSETISDSMKDMITNVFGCRVYDYYGLAERVCYIHTCEKGNYHILPEYGVTELVPFEGGDEKTYKIVATGFWNLAMPLLRYDTGDIVNLSNSSCSCGRQFPLVKAIIGRSTDVIKTSSGKVIGPTIIARILKEANNIYESQAIQEKIDHVVIQYVPSEEFSAADLVEMRRILNYFLPQELKIDLVSISSIPRTSNGKLKLIVSYI